MGVPTRDWPANRRISFTSCHHSDTPTWCYSYRSRILLIVVSDVQQEVRPKCSNRYAQESVASGGSFAHLPDSS